MVSREAALLNECITMMDQPFEEEDAFPAAPSSYAAEFAPLQRLRSISQEARPHFDPSIEDSLSPQDSLSAAGATPALGGQVLDAGPLQGTASVQPGLTHPQFVDASTPYPPARFDGHAPGLGRLNPEWRNGGGAEGYVQGHVPAGSSGVAVEKLGRRKSSSEADSAFGTWSTFEDHNGVDVWPHRVSRQQPVSPTSLAAQERAPHLPRVVTRVRCSPAQRRDRERVSELGQHGAVCSGGGGELCELGQRAIPTPL
ncbi:hypothetical protein T484DRAFT_1835993 [Baffinella frigidus]|nr:hypothetical protein T484DRAFT_1835993 [Cryptophyta sp. CCMP2293]